jgi:hypothetical protein
VRRARLPTPPRRVRFPHTPLLILPLDARRAKHAQDGLHGPWMRTLLYMYTRTYHAVRVGSGIPSGRGQVAVLGRWPNLMLLAEVGSGSGPSSRPIERTGKERGGFQERGRRLRVPS